MSEGERGRGKVRVNRSENECVSWVDDVHDGDKGIIHCLPV